MNNEHIENLLYSKNGDIPKSKTETSSHFTLGHYVSKI